MPQSSLLLFMMRMNLTNFITKLLKVRDSELTSSPWFEITTEPEVWKSFNLSIMKISSKGLVSVSGFKSMIRFVIKHNVQSCVLWFPALFNQLIYRHSSYSYSVQFCQKHENLRAAKVFFFFIFFKNHNRPIIFVLIQNRNRKDWSLQNDFIVLRRQ